MVNDATNAPDDGVSDRDYAMLLATLSVSARGQAFLAEYARRNRLVETEMLLTAIARLEAMIATQQASVIRPAPVEPAASIAPAPTASAMAQATLWVEAVPSWEEAAPEETPAPAADQLEAPPSSKDPFEQLMSLSEEERLALFT